MQLLNETTKHNDHYTNNLGYTLLELIVVLIILTLITSVVLINFEKHIQTYKILSITYTLKQDLLTVRSRAIRAQRRLSLDIDTHQNKYWIKDYKNKNAPYRSIPNNINIRGIFAKEDIISSYIGRIYFYKNGSSNGGKIILSHEKQEYTISVDWLTGSVNIQKNEQF